MFALFFAALTSCQDDEGTVLTEPVTVEFTAVQQGALSGEPLDAANFVINTSQEWNAFKSVANSAYGIAGYDVFEGVAVDFEQYTALAVIDQWWGNGGYSVQITSVIDNGGEINVGIDHASVEEGNVTSVHCQPFHVIKIPKTTLPVVFE
ncbi:hypothetical protein SAMN05444144_11032 [Flavobacterium akiainvivens]|nr:hypothetical protein SAMN05444144_11032 [Flavobacterium akiainvivens]